QVQLRLPPCIGIASDQRQQGHQIDLSADFFSSDAVQFRLDHVHVCRDLRQAEKWYGQPRIDWFVCKDWHVRYEQKQYNEQSGGALHRRFPPFQSRGKNISTCAPLSLRLEKRTQARSL